MTDTRPDTKDRLLDAAEELFLDKGFEHVSIRELAAAADVNVAAVNYHFHGKDNLYAEVVQRRFTKQRDLILGELEQIRTATTGVRPTMEQVIRRLVRVHLASALDDSRSTALMKRMLRELYSDSNETTPLFLREMIAPVFAAFSGLVLEAKPGMSRDQVSWAIASVVGQIHHLAMRWERSRLLLAEQDESVEVMMQAFPALRLDQQQYIEEVTDHITRFSAAAIEALYPEVTS